MRSRALRMLRRRSTGCLALLIALGAAGSAGAVVHSTGDGTGNTAPPPDDPGLANVGVANSLTGTYLRGGWVLAADHVGAPQIVLGGVTYQPVPGSHVQFVHDASWNADLGVYRIDGTPALPFPRIASTPPQIGEPVVVAGNGWNRQATVTAWDASWVEVAPPGTYRGYKRAAGRSLRWGRNEIEFTDYEFEVAGRKTRTFGFFFDEAGVVDEAQVVNGDSGGAVWVQRNGQWELAGILFLSFNAEGNQAADTVAFGMATGAVDLSFYRDQIMAAVVPPIPVLPGPWALVLVVGLLGSSRRALGRVSG